MERLQTFNVSISNGNIKYPIGKSIFGVKNLPLKLFPATVANADIRSLKSLHTFLKECLYHMLVKFKQNRMVQTTRNFELLRQKTGFFKTIFDKALAPFWKTFLQLKQLFNAKLLISRLLSCQCSKNYISPTRVTRLQVAPNMVDPISIKDSVSSLNFTCNFTKEYIVPSPFILTIWCYCHHSLHTWSFTSELRLSKNAGTG